jgi:2-polyprenyl-6-methoxyphenol hydroxylase-like FAD-dependent oxidoreductase
MLNEPGSDVRAFYTAPTRPRWTGKKGGVIMLGHAAHAILLTAGQGANQAFEHGVDVGLAARPAKG